MFIIVGRLLVGMARLYIGYITRVEVSTQRAAGPRLCKSRGDWYQVTCTMGYVALTMHLWPSNYSIGHKRLERVLSNSSNRCSRWSSPTSMTVSQHRFLFHFELPWHLAPQYYRACDVRRRRNPRCYFWNSHEICVDDLSACSFQDQRMEAKMVLPGGSQCSKHFKQKWDELSAPVHFTAEDRARSQ
jgi:hypothetical protein